MVNNVKGNAVNGSNNPSYLAKNQQVEQAKQESVAKTTQQNNSTKAAEKDSVALTPQAKQLKDLQKKISEADGFDRKKVEDIKQAISDGNYKINFDKLADKLSQFEFEI